jgi:hypothetical protein
VRADDPTPCPVCKGTGETYSEQEYDESHWRECEACDGYGITVDPWSRRCYLAISQEAVGWPANYREDLTVHDRHFCEEVGPDMPIAWIVRKSGTHMLAVTPEPIDGAGNTGWGFIRSCFSPPSGIGNCRFYGWDGRVLREHADAEALAKWVYSMAQEIEYKRKRGAA